MDLDPGNHQEAAAAQEGGGDDGQTAVREVIKGQWNAEEDSKLREMVALHGEGNWVAISTGLPGRTGKKCRARWMNNLRPDINKSNVWTDEEDKALIEAHKYNGNRWCAIAKSLSRSENSIKNHWNATKRSLGKERWVKKKKSGQVPLAFGQLSPLEKYIISLEETSSESEQMDNLHEVQAFPNTVMEPLHCYNQQTMGISYMDDVSLPGVTVPPQMMDDGLDSLDIMALETSYNLVGTEVYTNPEDLTATQPVQAYASNDPRVADRHVNYPLPQDMSLQDPHGTTDDIDFDYPFPENVGWESFDLDISDVLYNEAAPSITGGNDALTDASTRDAAPTDAAPADDLDVFQMATMVMYSPEYDITLDDPTKYI